MYRDYIFHPIEVIDALVDRQSNSRGTCANGIVHGVIAVAFASDGASWITLVIKTAGPLRPIDASARPASAHRAGDPVYLPATLTYPECSQGTVVPPTVRETYTRS